MILKTIFDSWKQWKTRSSLYRKALNIVTVDLAKSFELIALFTSDHCDAAFLDKLYAFKIKHIALRSAGFDHVDIEKAKALGIQVANVPEY